MQNSKKICPNCQTENARNAKFCKNCGKNIERMDLASLIVSLIS